MGFLDRFRSNRAQAPRPRSQPAAPAQRVAGPFQPGQPRFAVVDVETTGLSAAQHRIVEIAIVTTDPWGRVLDEWSARFNPQGPVGATHIHGITDADVAHAPVFATVIGQLNQRLAGAAIAAHHAKFDLGFLRSEYVRAGWDMPHPPALCTLASSEYYLPSLARRRLADCCGALGAPLSGAHTALGDARATAALLAAFMHPHVGYPPLPEHLEMPALALGVTWPAGPSRSPSASTPVRTVRPVVPPRVRAAMARQTAALPPKPLVELVGRFSLIDALDEGAPEGAVAYLEKLAEALEDGQVTTAEADGLAAVADTEGLTNGDISSANRSFVLALAHAALEDGKVTRAERAELQVVSDLLDVNQKVVPALLDRAEMARNQRMSLGLKPLPQGWAHGDPLRVGDKVVFTGCDDGLRTRLEQKSEELGVRIIGGVSTKTALLVADGIIDGTKAVKARALETRTVSPDVYAVLLEHLQPALGSGSKTLPKTSISPAPLHSAEPPHPTAADHASAPPSTTGPNPADARAWALAHGYEVGVRGRLPKQVLDAYTSRQSQ